MLAESFRPLKITVFYPTAEPPRKYSGHENNRFSVGCQSRFVIFRTVFQEFCFQIKDRTIQRAKRFSKPPLFFQSMQIRERNRIKLSNNTIRFDSPESNGIVMHFIRFVSLDQKTNRKKQRERIKKKLKYSFMKLIIGLNEFYRSKRKKY